MVFPGRTLREGRDQGCHPLPAAGWLADCSVMIVDGPEMAPPQPFSFWAWGKGLCWWFAQFKILWELGSFSYWRDRVKSILIIMQMPSFSNPLSCLLHANGCPKPPLRLSHRSPFLIWGLRNTNLGSHCCASFEMQALMSRSPCKMRPHFIPPGLE